MKRPLRRAAVVSVVCALLAVGCAGGDEGLDDVEPADLAIMVLPPEELGEAVAGLEPDGELSGTSTNADAASGSVDPADSPADMQRAGRRAGYDLHFVDVDLGALQRRAGIVELATGVELFGTPEEAAAYRERVLGGYGRFVGKEISPGVTLVRAEPEDAEVGDAGTLVRSTLSGDGFVVHSTGVDFAVDEVVGTVLVSRADPDDATEQALELAEALERRIRAAAAGQLDDAPVQIDGARPASAGTPPSGGKGLDRLALAVADLPDGTFVDAEDYAAEQGGVRFRRTFVVGTRKVGDSQLASLESAVVRAANPQAAVTGVISLALLLGGEQGPAYFAESYAQGGRFRPRDVRVSVVQAPGLPNAFIAFVRFRSPLGRVDSALGVAAVGRHIARLTAVAPTGRLQPVDVATLLIAQARRMARG
jgi:hypothetical protein